MVSTLSLRYTANRYFMNAFERFFCSSFLWRRITQRQLLPSILSGVPLGDHLLEIGAGYGAATQFLQSRVARVTFLEHDLNFIFKGRLQTKGRTSEATVCGDATQLPFANQTFTSVLAILVLHHIKSPQLQDQLFAECSRVLRPGGVFLAFDIPDAWFHRIAHIRSTFTPIDPATISTRLTNVGFAGPQMQTDKTAFRLITTRP
jgi:ubiquinone/menaquinone biosynthesis C-methylase UbiE